MEMKNGYVAWYRKYRPTKFSDIVGQKYLVESLKNIIKSGHFFHAYLFSGPRGTGKTSVAKIFANAINCTHKQDSVEPCENCIQNLNNSLDIIEMDAASHNGVKEIREIIENSINLPQVSPYKIYILDEVHMLSTSAFNAFLKTLEEPPKHMIFILATTEVHKIPLTILSRVQRYNFLGLNEEEICSRLEFILENEKIKYEKDTLKSIFLLSQSSLRDAISILEQAITFGNGVLNQKNINELFGLVSREIITNFVNALFLGQSKISFEILDQISLQSKNFQLFLESLIHLVKEWIIWKTTKTSELLEFYTINDLEKLEISRDFAFKFLEIAYSSLKDINFKEFQNLTIEVFVMKVLAQKTEKTSELIDVKPENLDNINKNINKKEKKVDQIETVVTNFRKTEDRIQKLDKLYSDDLNTSDNFKEQENYSSLFNRKLEQNLEKKPMNTDVFSNSSIGFEKSQEVINPFLKRETNDLYSFRDKATDSNKNLDFQENIDFSNSFLNENNNEKIENADKNDFNSFNSMEISNKNTVNFNYSFESNNENLVGLDKNLTNNSKFFKKIESKDYLTIEEALNFILLGKNFHNQDPATYAALVKDWNKNLPLFEYNVEFTNIVSILKRAEIISLGSNFVCFTVKNNEYEEILIETIRENLKVSELLIQIFKREMQAVALSKNLVEETKIRFKEMKVQGKEIVVKPFEIAKQTVVSKDDLKKLFFDK